MDHCFQNQLWGICSIVALEQLQLRHQEDGGGVGWGWGEGEEAERFWRTSEPRKVARTPLRHLSANQEPFQQ